MATVQNEFLLQLPPHVATSDAELPAVAGRIFQVAPARSVTIDSERKVAIVRLEPGAKLNAAGVVLQETAVTLSSDLHHSSSIRSAALVDVVSWFDPRDRSTSFIRMPSRVRGWRKVLYLMIAGAALSLGLLGVVLPGLPTTPFVLLGSYFLVRSSTRLHERLMKSRLFGGVLRDWHIHRGVRPHVRVRAVAVVALVVSASLLIARPPLLVVLAIMALAAGGIFVISRLPSVRATSFLPRIES